MLKTVAKKTSMLKTTDGAVGLTVPEAPTRETVTVFMITREYEIAPQENCPQYGIRCRPPVGGWE